MTFVTRYLPFSPSTTIAHASTYLLAVCLFSISFLVFLNAVVSFVITDLLGVKDGVGDLVGTLGFVDELVAIFACPFWGVLSDRVGVRYVCVAGYSIIGVSLFIFVQARDVYPQLLLARALFSVGGAATATMVTGILPAMSGNHSQKFTEPSDGSTMRSNVPESSDSQTTVTPANYSENFTNDSKLETQIRSSPSRLAGLVGLFTGCGALVALTVFLPLPTRFSDYKTISQAQAITYSFYVVGIVSLVVACACFFGLRGISGEEGKGLDLLFQRKSSSKLEVVSTRGVNNGQSLHLAVPVTPYWRLVLDSIILGIRDSQVGLGYMGGFVARASSVGITLFIPTYVNAYFIRQGFCDISPNDPSSELKKQCRAAYVLASELTGVSQLMALIFAPVFGYLSDRYRRFNLPILVASLLGIFGYIGFARIASPEPKNIDGRGGSPMVFIFVSLIGISQIGAIVCSLGVLGRAVLNSNYKNNGKSQNSYSHQENAHLLESEPLIPSVPRHKGSRTHLKGSIAGAYSLFGGLAILILTKLGGYLFDKVSVGAPFYIMALFNSLLLIVGIGIGTHQELQIRAKLVDLTT